MAQSGTKDESLTDLRLGRMALERGLLTPERLREAMAEQAQGVARGRKLPRRLGVILVERRFLTEAQLVALLEEISAQALEESAQRREDKLLGRILVARALARPERVEECLKVQSDSIEECEEHVPRLGELLIIEGHASEEAVRVAISIQLEMTFHCKKCAKVSRYAELDSKKPFCCPACRGAIDPRIPMPPPPPAKPEDPPAPEASTDSSLDALAPEAPAAPAPPPVELARLGKYQILRELGRGGMGVVYEALDTQLRRKVALKLMHPNIHGGREEVQLEVDRFVREARLAGNLSRHPNIVSVYEAGVLDGRHYIAMELVEGQSMAQWRRKGSVTIRHQVRVLRDVALAVHHAHQQGILHRDLKPQNVLVDPKNQPFVTDFGLAKETRQDVTASITISGKVAGTPAYMSPEQAGGGKRVARQSDVWALGVMLYEILTGRPPFRGQSPIEILMKMLRDPVPPPSEAAPNLARGALYRSLESICMKALAKKPGDRYSTAKGFADDLSKCLKGDEVRVAPPPPRKLYAVAAAGAGAVLIAILVLALRPSATGKRVERAERLMAQENWEGALAAWDQVLKQEPGDAKALAGRERARSRMEVAEARGDAEKARAALALLKVKGSGGVARDPLEWFVIGPFDNTGGNGFDTAYRPERFLDLSESAPGKVGPVAWRKVPTTTGGTARPAELDLKAMFEPSESVAVYALIHFKSPGRIPARLLVGSDDGVKVWCNGALVHQNNAQRALKADEDEARLQLAPGWNRLLFKVTQGTGGFALAMRLVDESGAPIEGLEFDAAGDLTPPRR